MQPLILMLLFLRDDECLAIFTLCAGRNSYRYYNSDAVDCTIDNGVVRCAKKHDSACLREMAGVRVAEVTRQTLQDLGYTQYYVIMNAL